MTIPRILIEPAYGPIVVTGVPPNMPVTVVPIGAPGPPGSAGVTDHGALTGLADDDHPQYLTSGRGDARYPRFADLAAEAAARVAHEERADNPHGVTAAQTGAATTAALAAEASARAAADAAKADAANVYTRAQTDALIDGRIAGIIGTAPDALDTLAELADALADSGDAVAALTLTVAGKEAGGTAAGLLAAHEAAADPHPQYLRQDEGDARADARIAAAIGDTVQGFSANLAALAGQAAQAFGRGLLNLADDAGLTAAVNTFTATLKGLVPAPGAATGRFLRDDGWAALPVSGGLDPLTALSSVYGGPTGHATVPAAAACSANRLAVQRLRVSRATTLTEIAVRTTTGAAAGGRIRLGIYRAGSNGLPADRLFGSGELVADVANSMVSVTGLSINLDPAETYFLCSVLSLGATMNAMRINASAGAPVGYHATGAALVGVGGFFTTFTFGALPADLSGTSWGSINVASDVPFILWR